MKICIYNLTTGVSFGGVEIFSLRLAETLSRLGEDVYIFTGRPSTFLSNEATLHSGKVQGKGLRVKTYHYLPPHYIPDLGTRFKKLVSRLSFAVFCFKDLCKEKFDIIHIQKPYDLLPALLVKVITGAKVILGSHGTDFYFGDRVFAKKVDGVFSCSSFNAKEIWERYRRKARVIYNGCDIDLFKPMGPDRGLKEKIKIGDSPVIFTAGRLVNWKRVDILISAIPFLKTQNFKVIICGEGDHKSGLLSLSKALGVEDRIIWLGAIPHEELPRYLSLASVFVQPSISESFGISICEAMAMGIPVVASRSGGVPEVVEDGVNGFLVTPGDIKKVAESIDILLADSNMRRTMGKEGRAKIELMFTWNSVAERVMEGYKEVLRR